jgi:DnaJ-domain-containing protein 1
MSAMELVVVAFGLFLGYWLVSKLMGGKPAAEPERTAEEPRAAGPATPEPRAWHEVLEISPVAPVEEIRDAYKRLMSLYHPDKVASLGPELGALAERKSKEVTVAYREAMQSRGLEP